MKKLMIAAAIVCAAAFTQAGSLQWSLMNLYKPTVADASKDVTTPFLATAGDKFLPADGISIVLNWVNGAGNDVYIGTYDLTGEGAIASTTLGVGSDSDLYKAMVAESGYGTADIAPTYHYTTTYTTSDGVFTLDGTIQAAKKLSNIGASNVSASARANTAGYWTYTANVPEPTSTLLMLIGVAGLALRRRRA